MAFIFSYKDITVYLPYFNSLNSLALKTQVRIRAGAQLCCGCVCIMSYKGTTVAKCSAKCLKYVIVMLCHPANPCHKAVLPDGLDQSNSSYIFD